MENKPNYAKINTYIKEFLKFNGYTNTLECLEAEEKMFKATSKDKQPVKSPEALSEFDQQPPKMYRLFEGDGAINKREAKFENDLRRLQQRHSAVLQSARQIFSISVDCLKHLEMLKDGASTEGLAQSIDNYKIQLGKYHRILLLELKHDQNKQTQLISERVLRDHKTKLISARDEEAQPEESLTEILLSLRVNALQVPPEHRRNFVTQLIKCDIFNVEAKASLEFLHYLMKQSNHNLKHALAALISVIVSTADGIQYLTQVNRKTDLSVLEKSIDLLKEQEDGSVSQRFLLAVLQKMSAQNSQQMDDVLSEQIIECIAKKQMIPWCLALLSKFKKNAAAKKDHNIHVFCLDFSSALLANILHASSTLESLEQNPRMTEDTMEQFLLLIAYETDVSGRPTADSTNSALPVSSIIHCLISLSYLSKERFSAAIEATNFIERISNFVEQFSQLQIGETDQESQDKKSILDLCAHMFHPKDTTNANDVSATMEYNELKQEEKIREFQNAQGHLIFECFQDEVN